MRECMGLPLATALRRHPSGESELYHRTLELLHEVASVHGWIHRN